MSEKVQSGVGIALSGGGFRATLFHLGALWRLNELGWLPRFKEVTSVSGGSITAALLALRWGELDFNDKGVASNLGPVLIEPLRDFCSRTIDVGGIAAGVLSPFHHPSELIERAYRRRLYGEKTLADLPVEPRFTIYATSLQTGRSVRFYRGFLRDYRLGKAQADGVRISKAVAASSAFPPPLCPVSLRLPAGAWTETKGADLFDRVGMRTEMKLGDGGIYDNLGLQRIARRYETVLVSDAGAPFGVVEKSRAWRVSQLARAKRALGIITDQARGLRKVHLIEDLKAGRMEGTYRESRHTSPTMSSSSTSWIRHCARTLLTPGRMAGLRTRLNKFDAAEQEGLINWAYALTDAAMRRHVLPAPTAQGTWPYPDRPL